MPREQEPSRPAVRASRGLVLVYTVVLFLPVLLFLAFLGSLPAPG